MEESAKLAATKQKQPPGPSSSHHQPAAATNGQNQRRPPPSRPPPPRPPPPAAAAPSRILALGEPLVASPTPGQWLAAPTEVPSAEGASALTVGDQHSLMLTPSGAVLSCGANDCGQLGRDAGAADAAADSLGDFAPVRGLSESAAPATQVAAGGSHSLALLANGRVMAWGSNACGQLGPRDDASGFTVGPVTPLLGHRAVQVAAGLGHSLILTSDHQVFAFGDNSSGQLGRGHCQPTSGLGPVQRLAGLPIRQVACGARHSFALSHSAVLLAWGSNSRGQLGCGTAATETDEVQCLPVECAALRNHRACRVACGAEHTAVATWDGGLFTFGAGGSGQLGHNQLVDEPLPRQVQELMGSRVDSVACSTDATFACCRGGRLYAFGAVGSGGAAQSGPRPLAGVADGTATGVFAGGRRAFVRTGTAAADVGQLPTLPPDGLLSLDCCNPDDWPSVLAAAGCAPAYARAFLRPGEHDNPRPGAHGVDMDAAADFLRRLGETATASADRRSELQAAQAELLADIGEHEEVHLADAECLRLLLLMPLSPAFDAPGPLQPALAGLALRLPRPLTGTLLSWIADLRLRHFARLVRALVQAAQHALDESAAAAAAATLKPTPHGGGDDGVGVAEQTAAAAEAEEARVRRLLPCLEFLKRLHVINKNRHEALPVSSFHLADIGTKVSLEQDYRVWTENKGQFSFLKYTFVFDGPAKMQLLKVDAQMQMEQAFRQAMMFNLFQGFTFGAIFDLRSPFLVLKVARQNLIHDAVVGLGNYHPAELKKPLKISFKGEEAVDEGGLTKEFFLLIFRQILDPVYGMFCNFDSNLVWFNHSTLDCPENFSLIGTLLGLAIYNSILAAVPFPLALFKKLLRQPVALDDLKELDPTVGRSLQAVLDAETAEAVDQLELTFEIETKVFDHVRLVPLSRTPEDRVTLGNREAYVTAYVDFVLNRSCSESFEAFRAGFERACGSPVLPLLEPTELQAIINGESEYFDWDQLERGAIYVNQNPDYQQLIGNFWSVFHHDLDEEQKRKFLRFLTGSDRVPVQGMSAVRLRIQVVHCSPSCLPVAHTCYNMLDLPRYPDKETLRQKLLLAIDETEGFSLV